MTRAVAYADIVSASWAVAGGARAAAITSCRRIGRRIGSVCRRLITRGPLATARLTRRDARLIGVEISLDEGSDSCEPRQRRSIEIVDRDVEPDYLRKREFVAVEGPSNATALFEEPFGFSVMVKEEVAGARAERGDLLIVARARDAAHAAHLYRAGASDAVPETIEASLQLSEAVLVDVGVPIGPVIASIHDKRAALQAEIKTMAPGAQVRSLGRRRLRDRL